MDHWANLIIVTLYKSLFIPVFMNTSVDLFTFVEWCQLHILFSWHSQKYVKYRRRVQGKTTLLGIYHKYYSAHMSNLSVRLQRYQNFLDKVRP